MLKHPQHAGVLHVEYGNMIRTNKSEWHVPRTGIGGIEVHIVLVHELMQLKACVAS